MVANRPINQRSALLRGDGPQQRRPLGQRRSPLRGGPFRAERHGHARDLLRCRVRGQQHASQLVSDGGPARRLQPFCEYGDEAVGVVAGGRAVEHSVSDCFIVAAAQGAGRRELCTDSGHRCDDARVFSGRLLSASASASAFADL